MIIVELNIRPFHTVLSDYVGFKLSENGSVLSVENVYCMNSHKAFAYHGSNTSLMYHLQRAHDSTSDPCVFIFLTKINY